MLAKPVAKIARHSCGLCYSNYLNCWRIRSDCWPAGYCSCCSCWSYLHYLNLRGSKSRLQYLQQCQWFDFDALRPLPISSNLLKKLIVKICVREATPNCSEPDYNCRVLSRLLRLPRFGQQFQVHGQDREHLKWPTLSDFSNLVWTTFWSDSHLRETNCAHSDFIHPWPHL